MNSENIKLHIWDMDGTIIDSMRMWDDIFDDYLATIGIEAPENLPEILDPLTFSDAVEYVQREFALPGTIEDLYQGIFDRVLWHYRNDLVMFSGVRELLEEQFASGTPMVLLSNSPHIFIDAATERHDLKKYFRRRYSTDDYGITKDRPEIFQIVCEEQGVAPADAVVYDDSEYALRAAKAAGCTVVEFDKYRMP